MAFNTDPNFWLQLGSGLLSGGPWNKQIGAAAQNVGMYTEQAKQKAQAEQQKNMTAQWLEQNDKELAQAVKNGLMTPADAFKVAYEKRNQKPDNPFVKEVNGKLLQFNNGKWDVAYDAGPAPVSPTELQKNLQAAGIMPGTPQYQEIMLKAVTKPMVSVDTGVKLPTGYQWVDPNDPSKGMAPVKGGPGEQLPGELAARVGMADDFLSKKDDLKRRIKAGEATGPIDVFRGKVMGTNSTYADIENGAEALTRMLTGAGMNIAEAEDKARRFLPTYYDDDKTLQDKVDRLTAALQAAKDMAMRGRGNDPQDPANAQQNGVIDAQDYFKD